MMSDSLTVEKIEGLISEHPLVHSCVVVGEAESFYSVLVSPDKANLIQTLRDDNPNFKCNFDSYQSMNRIEVRSYFCDLLEQVNAQLKERRIERFVLLNLDKSKSRDAICADNTIIIESFYQEYIAGVG